jgi:competence ComEA-like helix-hairpin-helix protein
MRKLVLFFFLIILISNLSAKCSDEQININTASAEDLDKITYVGPATAAKIIAGRPFNSVDDLINVSGIGETKLKAIKDEGLACVEMEDKEATEEEEKTKNEVKEEIEETSSEISQSGEESLIPDPLPATSAPIINEFQVIKLNSKGIKNNNSFQENKEENSIKKYAGFGLTALCILVLILLFLQNKKNGLE